MSSTKVGRFLKGFEARDAIHIAILPVIAGEGLRKGQRVGLVEGTENTVGLKGMTSFVGVVDPFLTRDVKKGESFYLFLEPNTITSLRHDWTHPSFPLNNDSQDRSLREAKASIAKVAQDAGVSFEEIMDYAQSWIEWGEYQCEGGRWEGFSVPEYFWDAYEVVTGKTVEDTDRGTFFTCSC